MLTLLSALQQADAAFPSGAFAFSNGIEGLAATGMRLDETGLAGVLMAVLRHRWVACDRVALVLAWRAGITLDRLTKIDHALEAATLPQTLRRGSRSNGAALLAAHVRIETPGATALQHGLDASALLGHLAVLQGALWRQVGLDEAQAVAVGGYTVASGMASAAVRLGCLGALAAQRALLGTLPLITELSHIPVEDDGDDRLVGSLPWLDVASARHETAGLRLFSS